MPACLDLRLLPPPEPMRRILDAVQALAPGQRLHALTPCRPEPLLAVLDQWGCRWEVDMREPAAIRVTIEWPAPPDPDTTP